VRKLLPIVSALVVSTGMTIGVAAADTSCSVSDTGPGSTNNCTSESSNTLNENCQNNITTINDNSQNANSGSANVSDNTTGGNASTGNASNSNDTNTQINANCGQQVASVTPSAPTPSAPRAGGQGAAAPVSVAVNPGHGAAPQAVAALPETGSNTARNTAIAGVTVLGGLTAASQFGTAAYRRKLFGSNA